MPTYSEVLATYPAGTELCVTDAQLTAHPDGSVELSGTIWFSYGKFVYQCYGTKVTIRDRSTLDGKIYEPGTKLTVDKDLNWIEVSSWE
jgi:hypothetical protein